MEQSIRINSKEFQAEKRNQNWISRAEKNVDFKNGMKGGTNRDW